MAKARKPKHVDGCYFRESRGKKSGGVYYVRTDPVTGGQLSTGTADPAEAKAFVGHRRRLASDPAYRAPYETTLGTAITQTLTERATAPEGTQHMYRTKLGHVARVLGEQRLLASLSLPLVKSYVATRRREGAKDQTIHKELSCFRKVLRVASEHGWWSGDYNRMRPAGVTAVSARGLRWLTRDEIEKLRGVMTADGFAWLALLVSTGMRRAEALRARPEDYDTRARTLFVHGSKTAGSRRRIPILQKTADLFADALPRLPLSEVRLDYWCERANVPAADNNACRHTFASWLIQDGVPFGLVAELMGHTDERMVRRVYGHLAPDHLRQLIEGVANTSPQTGSDATPGCPPGQVVEMVSPSRARTGMLSPARDFKSVAEVNKRTDSVDLAHPGGASKAVQTRPSVTNSSPPDKWDLAASYAACLARRAA